LCLFFKEKMSHPSCSDHISVGIVYSGKVIIDIVVGLVHRGGAASVCCSSASINALSFSVSSILVFLSCNLFSSSSFPAGNAAVAA
jgi:hypothetical protein